MKLSWMVGALFASLALAGCEMIDIGGSPRSYYKVTLSPDRGVASTGSGMGFFTYDRDIDMLSYIVSFEGLTGPAVAAHIYRPTKPGANAAPVIDLLPSRRRANAYEGYEEMTAAQAADMAAGKYFVSVDTAANEGGEIRGQIVHDPSVRVR